MGVNAAAVRPGPTKVYLDAPYASIRWESQGRWVVAEWKASASSCDFRAAQEMTLRAIDENHASRFLADTRNAKLVLVEDERWMCEELMARFALTGLRWTAIVIPVNSLARLIATDVARKRRTGLVESREFETLAEAESWLSGVGHPG
jgi:hypothetical protein